MTVRVRGIYATALTEYLADVVQPSPSIRERVAADLPDAPAAARVETTDDRQGVGVHGEPDRVAAVAEHLRDVAGDALGWPAALPLNAVYAGEVTDTLGSGALVDVGDGTGLLPFGATSRRIETGECLRVQVAEAAPPWVDERPVLDTDVRIRRGLLELVRGRDAGGISCTFPGVCRGLSTRGYSIDPVRKYRSPMSLSMSCPALHGNRQNSYRNSLREFCAEIKILYLKLKRVASEQSKSISSNKSIHE